MKRAVILFNLGGPNNLEAVEPFLFNLFYDKNIISLPNPLRFFIAKLISRKRAPIAKEIYEKIGGKSPILEETVKQAEELEKELNGRGEDCYKIFISMRYWHPFSYETILKVKEFTPDDIILLPLYPQYSTTTSKSSIEDWLKAAKKEQLSLITKIVENYHNEDEFIKAHINQIKPYYEEARKKTDKLRILFSAHGLPEKVIKAGDPYQKQVEETAQEVVNGLKIADLDWVVCYQSRVGPLKWIGPSTEDEIKRAGMDRYSIIIVPIAFVSEHSETLVELDMEYAELAKENGVDVYIRVPALGCNANFIKSLANCVISAR